MPIENRVGAQNPVISAMSIFDEMRELLLLVICIYLIALMVALFFSDQMIFKPQQAGYRDNAAILKLTSSNGAKISATYL
jgi:hypothetical protein